LVADQRFPTAAEMWAVDADALALTEASDWKMPGYETRREHALGQLSILEGRPEPLLRDIRAWTLENLPPSEPSILIHGDLLGQNIRLAPGKPLGLLDWEHSRLGDPAYDLAIVTRGARRPFQMAGGLDRLLEAYAGYASEIAKEHVRIYELCMMAGWYLESLPEGIRSPPPEERFSQLQRVFRRATDGA
jgi:aminoglycoside phosphotransferase (APT) family kinase protein